MICQKQNCGQNHNSPQQNKCTKWKRLLNCYAYYYVFKKFIFSIEPPWIGSNQLNPKGRYWSSDVNQNPENIRNYETYERSYQSEEWWIKMKRRLEKKTEAQIDLDRKLFEEVGSNVPINGREAKPDLAEIKKLVKSGATIDHWVGGGYDNAIQLAVANNSVPVAEFLLLENMNFINNMFGIYVKTPLGRAIWCKNENMANMIIGIKHDQHPIYTFLTEAITQTKEQKNRILEAIGQNYPMAKTIKSDFKKIREGGKFNNETVQINLSILFDHCRSKGDDYLFQIFGQSYSIKDPLCWRYKSGQHYFWFAEWMTKEKMETGKWTIKNNRTHFKVKHIFNLLIVLIKITFFYFKV